MGIYLGMEGLPLCEEVWMEGPLWGGDDSASVWISSLRMECFYMCGGYISALRVCLLMVVSVSVWRVYFFMNDYAWDKGIGSVWSFCLGK